MIGQAVRVDGMAFCLAPINHIPVEAATKAPHGRNNSACLQWPNDICCSVSIMLLYCRSLVQSVNATVLLNMMISSVFNLKV